MDVKNINGLPCPVLYIHNRLFIRFGYICIYLLPIATRIVRSRWSSYFQIHRHGSLRRERAYSLFSMLSSVQGIAPVCAPVLGGVLLEVTDWKGIFWILVLIGILLIMALAFFKESLNNEQQHCGVFATFRNYIPVFQNAQFMRYVLVQAFAMGVMFTYIAASPFIFQEHFNMSPLAYSLCFGANAIAIMLGSLTVSLFHDATDALRVGSIGFGIMSLFVAAALFFSTSVWPVEVSLFVFMLFLGVILPSSTTLALDLERKNSGNASALLGF